MQNVECRIQNIDVELSVAEIARGILANVGLWPVRVGEDKNIHRNVELSVSEIACGILAHVGLWPLRGGEDSRQRGGKVAGAVGNSRSGHHKAMSL